MNERERFVSKAKERLATAENRKGRLDFKGYDDASALDAKLKALRAPGYKGCAALGSRTRRHERIDKRDPSDSDVAIFYDPSQIDAQTDVDALLKFDVYVGEALLDDDIAERDVHPLLTPIDQQHVEEIIALVLRGEELEDERLGYVFGQTVMGENIEPYQRAIATRINELEDDDKNKVISALAAGLVNNEATSDPKIHGRLPGYSKKARKDVADARAGMWEEQLTRAIAVYSRK